MNVQFTPDGWLSYIEDSGFRIPFTESQGLFVETDGVRTQIPMYRKNGCFRGNLEALHVSLSFVQENACVCLRIRLENRGKVPFRGTIGLQTGVDSWMEEYPQWHKPFFPTLLRCEKTHLWGYYRNTAGNALAIATSGPVASYDIRYNRLWYGDYGHRIDGTELLFFTDCTLPSRHPQNQKVLEAGTVYRNTVFLIPVSKQSEIIPALHETAGIPMIQAEKYTYTQGERLSCNITGNITDLSVTDPSGNLFPQTDIVMREHGIYTLRVTSDTGKISEATFYCRPSWDFYLQAAAREALDKPQKATTHVESFYGLFSCVLAAKRYRDPVMLARAKACFEEILPLMFDFHHYEPIVIPDRIQNTALLISLLVDMYEASGEVHYLEDAGAFADWLIRTSQTPDGVYRCDGRIHYTCVIYIAKAVLELALAEKTCPDPARNACYAPHYESVRRAVDELVESLDNIETEGESTLEDGMIACSALQIGMFALTLPDAQRGPYIRAAKKMMEIHGCLEQQLIPDCRCNGASLRYWEAQYDVMVMANMLNSPHGWSAWTAYAHYYLYLLTGKKQHLLRLMNGLGSCAQLMTLDGTLRWSYCPQPYVKANTLVPDRTKPVGTSGFRGKYESREYGESYIDMISGWYHTGEQKLVGGYEGCPLYLKDETLHVDNQGGCCDNDVHEIFKCIEETVLGKAFVHENEDESILTYGCTAFRENGQLRVIPEEGVKEIQIHTPGSTVASLQETQSRSSQFHSSI